MRVRFGLVLGVALLLAFPVAGRAQAAALNGWQVASSPAKYTIDLDHPEKPAPTSLVSIFLSDPHWAGMTVAFFTDSGQAVGSQLISAVPGEAAVFLFDTSSGAKRYDAYVGSPSWPPKQLTGEKAGVMLESKEADPTDYGQTPNSSSKTLKDMEAAWAKSTVVEGVAMTNGIYEGGNRFGPLKSLLLHFQGHFDAKTNEHLELATQSTDASFVLIDGKEVVEWPGEHYGDYTAYPELRAQMGPPRGGVDVAAGTHVLDYYNHFTFKPGYWVLMATLAIKGGPFADFTILGPDSPFFRPVAYAHVVSFDPQSDLGKAPGVPQIGISWAPAGETYMSEERPEQSFIQLQFTCLNTVSTNTVNWTFDDGSTGTGNVIKHLFAHSGLRMVKVALKNGDQVVASLALPISVHIDWTQPGQVTELNPEFEAEMLKRDPMTMSAPDVATCFSLFGFFNEKAATLKFLPAIIAKIKDVPLDELPYMGEAIDFVGNSIPDQYGDMIQLLREINDLGKADPHPSPPLAAAFGDYRMRLANAILSSSDNVDEAAALLNSIDLKVVYDDVPVTIQRLKGDVAVAKGDFPGAEKMYDMTVANISGVDARSSIRRTGMISIARDYIAKGEYPTAQDTLNQLVLQDGTTRLDPDWILAQVQLFQEGGKPRQAYLEAKRLLPIFTDGRRAELLFRLTTLAYGQGDNDLGNKCLVELLKKFPYSEEAALAKLKWPGRP